VIVNDREFAMNVAIFFKSVPLFFHFFTVIFV